MGLTTEQLKDAYGRMCLARAFERKCEELFMQGQVRGSLHMSIGQEASAAGTALALRDDDLLILDGEAGIVIIDPDPVTLHEYGDRQQLAAIESQKLGRLVDVPCTTLDGQPIGLFANIESPTEAEAAMRDARERLAGIPAEVVVSNHVMGLYELAAIHLSNQPPRLDEAQLAIDAFGALLGAISGRLGEDEATLQDALAQIRLAFVQIKASWEGAATQAPVSPGTTEEDGGD